jgi:hypothetical protein
VLRKTEIGLVDSWGGERKQVLEGAMEVAVAVVEVEEEVVVVVVAQQALAVSMLAGLPE